MSTSVFDTPFDKLPRELPIFPLPGAMLLPEGHLPLNIFEPRYLNMFLDSLKGDRLIGMVQPVVYDGETGGPELYEIGCVGRVTRFEETEDDRLLVALTGVCRFRIVDQLDLHHGYRRVVADYEPFRDDMMLDDTDQSDIDRDRLLDALRAFFKAKDLTANWDAIDKSDDRTLVTSLAMICPFRPQEKQALLEVNSTHERAEMMTALLRMNSHDQDGVEQGPVLN